MRKTLMALSVLALVATAGCKGIRHSNDAFVTHAESFRIIGYAIPEDDQQAAWDLVPAGASVTNVSSSAADWTSIWGVWNNIIGFHCTQIGGVKGK